MPEGKGWWHLELPRTQSQEREACGSGTLYLLPPLKSSPCGPPRGIPRVECFKFPLFGAFLPEVRGALTSL